MQDSEKITRFTFRIPEQLLNQLKDRANFLGVSVNALILQILWEWADEPKSA